ncbi:MAG: hypothetical protein ABGW87_06750 [Sphingomonadaceae bacterium]
MPRLDSIDCSVDVSVDPVQQEYMWVASRVGWIIMLLIVVAAFLGFTGSGGVFAHQSVGIGQAHADIPRVSRWAATDYLTVRFESRLSKTITVLIPQRFLTTFTIEAVSPQPSSVMATSEGELFTFDTSAESGPSIARFSIRANAASLPKNFGSFHVAGVKSKPITITILP